MTMDTFCSPSMDLTFPTRILLILYNTVPKGKKKKRMYLHIVQLYIQSTILHSLIYTPYIYWCRRHETMETVLARTFHPTKQLLLIKTKKPTHHTSLSPLLQDWGFRPTKNKVSRLCNRTFLHYSRTMTSLLFLKMHQRWFQRLPYFGYIELVL